jgi:hypothetical protein
LDHGIFVGVVKKAAVLIVSGGSSFVPTEGTLMFFNANLNFRMTSSCFLRDDTFQIIKKRCKLSSGPPIIIIHNKNSKSPLAPQHILEN